MSFCRWFVDIVDTAAAVKAPDEPMTTLAQATF